MKLQSMELSEGGIGGQSVNQKLERAENVTDNSRGKFCRNEGRVMVEKGGGG